MLHEADLSRNPVSRQADVQGQIHSDQQHGRGNQERPGANQIETRPDRISGHEDMLRVLVEKNERDMSDFNEMREGYAALIVAYVDVLLEVSAVKDERVRWPLTLPPRVVVDVRDEFMNKEWP